MFISNRSLVFVALFAYGLCAHAAVNVTTWRYDAGLTGQNLSETALTPANVNTAAFGRLYTYSVDGFVYAQPLYLTGVTMAGVVRNVVFIATEHDSVYAFDADRNLLLWKASLIDAAHGAASGASTVPSGDVGTNDIRPEIGITGTPVIDAVAGALYVVAKSKEGGSYVHRLHALDVTTGNERIGSPVVIAGSVAGPGAGSSGGVIAFQSQWQLNRPSLQLYANHVYVGFGAHGDNGPYHGWLFAFDASTLARTAIYNSSPTGTGDGIWAAGAGLAADTVNGVPRLFFSTGNFFGTGTGGPNPTPPYVGVQSYSNAVVRLDLSNGGLQVDDEWTPFDEAKLSAADTDQGSGGVLLLPDQPGAHLHELVQVGKNGRIEVLDRDNLGGFNTFNNVAQEIHGQTGGLWSTPAYWNGNVYFWGNGDRLKQFSLVGGQLGSTPRAIGVDRSAFPGASPVVSANGTAAGVVWAIRTDAYYSNSPAVLYAFDANNVANLLYTSAQNAARDQLGKAVKFVVPIVANGKVYVGTQGEVDVFGLLASAPPTVPTPAFAPVPAVYPVAPNVTITDTLGAATIYYTLDGSSPSPTSTRYSGSIAVGATTTIRAVAVAAGFNNSAVASGTYTIGTPPSINFSNGFASIAGMTLNGSAVNSNDSRLQLTTGGVNQAGSAFWNTRVNVENFVSDFTFQLSGTAPIADGITFTIQARSPTALGPSGGGLGYGAGHPGGAVGIPNSVALKFDVFNNAGESADSIGIYTNGASPTTPAIDISSTGIVLASGDTLSAHLVYDGSSLTLTLKDPVNRASYTHSFPIDIPQLIGSPTAYVGFTGGTGGLTASQKILTWTLTPAAAGAPLRYEMESLSAHSSGPVFRAFAWPGFPDGVGTILDATKAGDSVSFNVNVPRSGSYDVHVTSKNYLPRGIWQLSVDGVPVGPPEDEYAPSETFVDMAVGTVSFAAGGSHTFTFAVTGHNRSSSGYRIAFDSLKLVAH